MVVVCLMSSILDQLFEHPILITQDILRAVLSMGRVARGITEVVFKWLMMHCSHASSYHTVDQKQTCYA